MSVGNGINLVSGFDLNSQRPLDNRTVFETILKRDSLPQINKYDGLICYVKETKKNYQLVDNSWQELTGDIIKDISIGEEEPVDPSTIVWIDTSVGDMSAPITNDVLNEIRYIFSFLQGEITKLKSENTDIKARLSILEEKLDEVPIPPDSDYTLLVLEDGSILTFESGVYMTL